jgi:hypothetical protein
MERHLSESSELQCERKCIARFLHCTIPILAIGISEMGASERYDRVEILCQVGTTELRIPLEAFDEGNTHLRAALIERA